MEPGLGLHRPIADTAVSVAFATPKQTTHLGVADELDEWVDEHLKGRTQRRVFSRSASV